MLIQRGHLLMWLKPSPKLSTLALAVAPNKSDAVANGEGEIDHAAVFEFKDQVVLQKSWS
jgi:hypothetical protein